MFVEIVNGAYGLTASDKLTEAKLEKADATTPRLVKKAEAYFRTAAPASAGNFDHYTPAEWLMLNPKCLEGKSADVAATLDRAEKLFTDLNALL